MKYPIVWFGMALAALTALTTYADIDNMIPGTVLNWIRLGTVVLAALGPFLVQRGTTSLADPRNAAGTPLIPDPKAIAERAAETDPPSTTVRRFGTP